MDIRFDWEYEPLSVNNAKKAKQYVCTNADLVFTFFPIDEFELVRDNALYLQARNGVYMAIGDDTIYTGMSESNDGGILARFANHLTGKNKKDFIKNVVMVTSVRENPEGFNSEVIRSLEHILYLQSLYTGGLTVFNTKGKTDYKINGRKSLKQFLKMYGTVCEMLLERGVTAYKPDVCVVDDISNDEVFITSQEGKYKAAVRVKDGKTTILKNSRTKIPNRSIFDFEKHLNLYTGLIDDGAASIVYDDGEFYFTFIEDFVCSNEVRFEDISNLLRDETNKNPKKQWVSLKSKKSLDAHEKKDPVKKN